MSVLDLARPEIRAMQPYSSARMEASGGEVLLNANESAWAPVGDDGLGCNRYPEPQPAALVEALATLYGVRREQLLVGRGSDEAIDLLVRAFCRAGRDAVLIQPPTFGMYAVCARVQDAGIVEVPLAADATLDVDAVLAALTPAVKLVFVCTPNNPTGQPVPRTELERLVQALAGRALLVVDEAYVEFADEGSVADLIDRYDNLAVLRTLSKAWALAGVRIGSLLASADVIALLRRIMAPYPLPLPSVDAALLALSGWGQANAREHLAVVRAERTRMCEALRWLHNVREVLPSQANFLAVRFDDAAGAYQRLLAAGIVVRDVRRYPNLGDALRITIGTPAENERVLAVLQETSP
ncbi:MULTISPECIES: histidinol-phosphate transaminase [Rhodanobacter]|uniref:histidinol-phosphate transaminase n=1 Tax=Rhodanobacter TaxID=75309 RepID=UPI000427ECB4|nr:MULTISPECIES: histidinol-phosphate transaminase [Rhodanobacter]KZC20284.1 histidinol-phosphate transaminase [Rhodanobacter denitrificans]UJJ52402.1 histidinol-phosphate transaminase [Rhodanobacter denitrificans]UJM95155.1 histidinol-phosphate transaminase [Rhodanobacter denitrificans]UJM98686.1 histidinol-phosphate transaminase [Rhodanobacter denitrificans]UJN21899.1 histidinol-phosphate transaminase [Rhodanobacter denitrificans]